MNNPHQPLLQQQFYQLLNLITPSITQRRDCLVLTYFYHLRAVSFQVYLKTLQGLHDLQVVSIRIWVTILGFLGFHGSPFYLAKAKSQCLMTIGRYSSLSTLCHSCGFARQLRLLKAFHGLEYHRSEDGVVRLQHFLVIGIYIYIYIYIYFVYVMRSKN